MIGTTINDRFKILSMVAKGGMGKVYQAEQAPLGRIVAVKVLHPQYSGENDPEFSKRFFLEASVVSKLKHPNTITVYDYGATPDGVYFMAMEYLEGRTLHRLIRDEGAMDPARALHILVQIARSLREAHAHGVIHRDLKPANIYLITHDDDSDFVKVLDFGLVKNIDEPDTESLTKTGLFMGSPKYMAPEQIRGDRVTAATDVYALGVMLFEMLAGKVPYDRPNSANLLLAHVNEPVPTLAAINPLVAVSPHVEDIVYRSMAKDPAERFQSMDEFIAALKQGGVSLGIGPSLTGEFHTSISAPRSLASGESARAVSPPPLPHQDSIPVSETLSASVISTRDKIVASASGPAAPAAPAQPQGGRNLVMLAGVVALALVATVGVYNATRRPPASTVTTVSPPRSEPAVHLVLESDPSGAEVFENGESLGRTPLRTTWTGPRGNPDQQHTFTFRLDGRADAIVTLTGSTLVHLARLQSVAQPLTAVDASTGAVDPAAPHARPVRPRPQVGAHAPARDGGGPSGYRQDPY